LHRHEIADAYIPLDIDIRADEASIADDGVAPNKYEIADARVRPNSCIS
jgi:hypothetical protein